MKQFILKYTTVLLAISLLISCSPDLTENNPNLSNSSNFWRNLEDTQLGLNTTYATLYSTYVLNVREEAVRSDLGYFSNVRPEPKATNDLAWTFWFQTFESNNRFVEGKWNALYRGIFRANQVIDALDRIKETSDLEEWTYQMAQARFFRGLFHFYASTTFNNGEVVIQRSLPVEIDEYFPTVSSKADVEEFFREDLQFAFDNLPASRSSQVAKVTKGTAATVLGTSYLYSKNYGKAQEYFTSVINSGVYSLVRDPKLLFTTAGEFNDESIFEINFDGAVRPEIGLFDEESTTNRLAFTSFSQNLLFSPTAWLVYEYGKEPMDPLDARNYANGAVTGNPADFKGVPLRASAMVTLPKDIETEVYQRANALNAPFLGIGASNASRDTRVHAYYKKYLNFDIYVSESANPLNQQKSSKNVTLNRYSEVLLMQAECLILGGTGGNPQGALDLINKVRERWGLTLLGTSGEFSGKTYNGLTYSSEDVMKQIMYIDKPLELSVEGPGIRFVDLRRWGLLDVSKPEYRFRELANTEFYLNSFDYVNQNSPDLPIVTRQKAVVVSASEATATSSLHPNEFTIPAANYSDVRAYYPIPASEIARNPRIIK